MIYTLDNYMTFETHLKAKITNDLMCRIIREQKSVEKVLVVFSKYVIKTFLNFF